VVDAAQWVSGWNRAAADMTGIATAKAIGRPVPFHYSADGAREELQFGDRWVEIAATRLAASGETVLSLHDITDHKALEEAKSLFLATTSHELKTPLTVISGFAATLRYRWHQLDDNQRIEALEAITRRSETLLRLIERLLISSQADVGNLYVLTEPVDLGAALREAVAGLDAVSGWGCSSSAASSRPRAARSTPGPDPTAGAQPWSSPCRSCDRDNLAFHGTLPAKPGKVRQRAAEGSNRIPTVLLHSFLRAHRAPVPREEKHLMSTMKRGTSWTGPSKGGTWSGPTKGGTWSEPAKRGSSWS